MTTRRKAKRIEYKKNDEMISYFRRIITTCDDRHIPLQFINYYGNYSHLGESGRMSISTGLFKSIHRMAIEYGRPLYVQDIEDQEVDLFSCF